MTNTVVRIAYATANATKRIGRISLKEGVFRSYYKGKKLGEYKSLKQAENAILKKHEAKVTFVEIVNIYTRTLED